MPLRTTQKPQDLSGNASRDHPILVYTRISLTSRWPRENCNSHRRINELITVISEGGSNVPTKGGCLLTDSLSLVNCMAEVTS